MIGGPATARIEAAGPALQSEPAAHLVPTRAEFRVPLFRYGFRPFFLGAGIQAVAAVMLWVHALHDGGMPPRFDVLWHGHELVFGFATAALAGFLLTAVPNWTAAGPVRGIKLLALFTIWLGARTLAFLPIGDGAPFAIVDLAFLPALAAVITPAIVRGDTRRNLVLVTFVLVLSVLNALWHGERAGIVDGVGLPALHGALGVFAVMIAIIGGRIVPAFTIGGMRMAGHPLEIVPAPRLDFAAASLAAATLLVWAAGLGGPLVAVLATTAAVVNAWRLARWQGWRTFGVPLVAVLHLGYGWLVIALALVALAALEIVSNAAVAHALGSGAVGTMVLAVMSRAALGHTGRALVASPSTIVAYGLVVVGGALRVASSAMTWPELVVPSGVLWSAGFAIFVLVYSPILLRARPDGRPG